MFLMYERQGGLRSFDCLGPWHCEGIKGIVGLKCFGTFEKQAPDLGIFNNYSSSPNWL